MRLETLEQEQHESLEVSGVAAGAARSSPKPTRPRDLGEPGHSGSGGGGPLRGGCFGVAGEHRAQRGDPAVRSTPRREEDPHGAAPLGDDRHREHPGGEGEAGGGSGVSPFFAPPLAWGCIPGRGDAHPLGGRVSHGGSPVSPQAEPQSRDFSYGWASPGGLLGEAASLLLLRVLARRRAVPPGLVFPAIDGEGHLGTATYVSLPGQGAARGGGIDFGG